MNKEGLEMSKQLLVLFELMDDQIEELKMCAKDYDIIFTVDDIQGEALEIVLGWSDQLVPFIEDEESQMKWVQYPFAGVDELPLELFEEKGILLTSGSGIHTYAVTESALGLLLGYTRGIVKAAYNKQEENWVDEKNLYELHGKSMMILGTGNIGQHLAQVAQAFGMKTIGINRSGREVENMDIQYVQEDLADVIDEADIVVNILPATKQTHHLFNKELFSKMKEGSIFINVGRGETVDSQALLAALDDGHLTFAGLDVFEEEPLPKEHPIWSHNKIIMTPHIGGRVENYPKHLYPIFMENFEAFIENEELPRNLVALENGY